MSQKSDLQLNALASQRVVLLPTTLKTHPICIHLEKESGVGVLDPMFRVDAAWSHTCLQSETLFLRILDRAVANTRDVNRKLILTLSARRLARHPSSPTIA